MRLNRMKRYIIIIVILTFCALSSCSKLSSMEQHFTELHFINGINDQFILEYYKQEIEEALDEEYILSQGIDIYYADCDLNNDGYTDKICILSSSEYTGSHGDTVDFLIKESGNVYVRYGSTNLRILQQDGSVACSVYVSDSTTNGYSYLIVRGFEYDDDVIVYFNGDFYIDNLPY